jgi:hypothetical protein
MRVSRRKFVGTASVAAAASLCAAPSFGFANGAARDNDGIGCTLLDLKSNCSLPESFAGMQAMLGDTHRSVVESDFIDRRLSSSELLFRKVRRVIAVAAAGSVTSETYRAVAESLESGATVLWESGAAFLDSSDFVQQRALTLDHFGISMERPIDVWSQSKVRKSSARKSLSGEISVGAANQSARSMRAIGHEQIPYVAYQWPRETHVRDFSRAIPVSAASGQAIAHLGEFAVAWSKPVGAGTLVFLGSPIGPALRAGDSDATSLLHSIIEL